MLRVMPSVLFAMIPVPESKSLSTPPSLAAKPRPNETVPRLPSVPPETSTAIPLAGVPGPAVKVCPAPTEAAPSIVPATSMPLVVTGAPPSRLAAALPPTLTVDPDPYREEVIVSTPANCVTVVAIPAEDNSVAPSILDCTCAASSAAVYEPDCSVTSADTPSIVTDN